MKLTFRGHRRYSSIRLDETNTMAPILLLYIHIKIKKLMVVKDFAQKQLFWIRWPLEAKPLSQIWNQILGQIWRQLSVSLFNSLSNAVFGFALAIIVPEIMEVFRNDVGQSRKTRKFCHFLALGPQFWLSRKIDWNSFVINIDELSNVFSVFFMTNRSLDRRGVFEPPPPPAQ